MYEYYKKQIAEVEAEINRLVSQYTAQVDTERAGKIELSKSRSGHKQAMVTVGKTLTGIFYTMVKEKKEYDATIYSKHRKQVLDCSIKRLQARIMRLQNECAACAFH